MSGSAITKPVSGDHRSRLRLAIGWLISITCIALIVWKVDLGGAMATLRDFDWRYILVSLVSLAFGYTMRIVRWRVMLNATGAPVTVGQCAAPFLGSIALNNVLPLRAGDIVRGTIFPASIGVTRTAAIGSIVMERLLDLMTLLLCLTIGTTALGTAVLPPWLTHGAIVLSVIGAVALFAIISFSGVLSRLAAQLASGCPPGSLYARLLVAAAALLEGFRQMSSPGVLASVFAFSMLAWVGETGVFWSVMTGFGIHAGPVAALLVTAFVTLSTLVPSSPGYVGPFHLAAVSVVVMFGISGEVATSFAVLAHLLLWVPTTLAGGIAMLARPELFRGAMVEGRQT